MIKAPFKLFVYFFIIIRRHNMKGGGI